VKEAEEYAAEDKVRMERIEKRNELESYLYNARNSFREEKVKEKLGDDAKRGEDIVQSHLTWLEANQEAVKEEYEERLKTAENELRPLLMKLYADKPGSGESSGADEGNLPGMHGQPTPQGPKVEEVD